jgi:diguanylate cyclase (GGDEF)-like protein
MSLNHELVQFFEDELPGGQNSAVLQCDAKNDQTWKILIVDDDSDVHQATSFGLSSTLMHGRPLEFVHAYSAREAQEKLFAHPDIAVILLDVVMEGDDSGLKLVRVIREEMNKHAVRIILRTGQPGYAPELSAIRDYDINDYKTKSELTLTRLYSSLTAALRAYDQICRLEASRRGLEMMVGASSELMRETGLRDFACGVVTQLAALIGVPSDGLVCVKQQAPGEVGLKEFMVIGAAGRFEAFINRTLDDIGDSQIIESLTEAVQKKQNVFAADHIALFVPSDSTPFATFIDTPAPVSEIDQQLIGVFCNNISLCAKNIDLVEKLQDVAFFDRLVRLPNRTAFVQAIDGCLLNGGADTHAVAVIDIDQFAEINNAFGHDHGDALLCALAQRLIGSFAQECLIARLSGDVFGLLGKREFVTPAYIRPALASPLTIDGLEQTLNVSIGYVALKDSPDNGVTVLKDATIARKLAKRQGISGDSVFSPVLSIEARARTHLLHELKGAFDAEHLFPMFQPQFCLQTGQLIGFEALMRWRGADGVLIAPDRFIPLAESSGMIVALGNWILQAALSTLCRLHGMGRTALRVAVNVSVVQFRDPDFVATVSQALQASGLPASALELEITESVAMEGAQNVGETLKQLRALGVAIAIDDFGTGYSSLSYLEKLPIDRLKIDRSFVQNIGQEGGSGRIVALIIRLAHQLGFRTIAEGIESEAQVNKLQELGCEEGQGFLLGKPMTESDLFDWLAVPGNDVLAPALLSRA